MDYYTHTVFEWITDDLGAQGAICAGGRYDGLVERLGGRATPGVGFAIGLDRAVLLHEVAQERAAEGAQMFTFVCRPAVSGSCNADCPSAGRLPHQRIRLHMGGGNLKKQLKKADASGAQVAVWVDQQSADEDVLTLKHLRDAVLGQESLSFDAGVERLRQGLLLRDNSVRRNTVLQNLNHLGCDGGYMW